MKCRIVSRRNSAFTATEIFIVLITLAAILFMLLAPAMRRSKAKSAGVHCTSNLKQVTLAFNLWAQEHGTGFPMELSLSKGGTRETAFAGNLLPSFVIMSNELRTPSVLSCPGDKKRKPATNFSTLTPANISYFLNVDAVVPGQSFEQTLNRIVAGDRNLTIAGSLVKPGVLHITNAADLEWAKWLHGGGGNVALIDGSVHQLTTKGLRDLLSLSGPTNRLIIP